MDGRRYAIREVATLTGVSPRTVHFYAQRRLIDPPLGRGRGRHYDDRHVRQIREIRSLQQMGVSLAEMPGAGRSGLAEQTGRTRPIDAAAALAPAAPASARARIAPAPTPDARQDALPSLSSVVRIQISRDVAVELAAGALPVTPGLLADLSSAVEAAIAKHRSPSNETETG